MDCRRKALGWLLMVSSWAATIDVAKAQTTPEKQLPPAAPRIASPARAFVPAPVPLDELSSPIRERVRTVLERPTLSSRGPLEAFHCRPAVYYWLLDHPDSAMRFWRGLGAKCTDIQCTGDGSFMWKDSQYGEVHWHTVVRTAKQRVWYAEGRVKPGVMLPAVSIQAVVVLNHEEGHDGNGGPAIRHQMDMILHTDSRAVNLAARLFGASAPRMAEEYVGQMEMFFGALAWYLSDHPDTAKKLFEEIKQTTGNAPMK
jgi:hypothetical protein